MGGIQTVYYETEEEYSQVFCKEYREPINTPDGFKVVCKDLSKTAKHICCGGDENASFQKSRAQRILWPKYILQNDSERKVLFDTQSKKLIFFYEIKKTAYAVICKPLKNGELLLVSGFCVGGKRAEQYRDGNPPYEFYKKSERAVENLNNP